MLALSDDELLALLNLDYVEDVLPAARVLWNSSPQRADTRADRLDVLETGYPAYDTSVGWFHYSDEVIAGECPSGAPNEVSTP